MMRFRVCLETANRKNKDAILKNDKDKQWHERKTITTTHIDNETTEERFASNRVAIQQFIFHLFSFEVGGYKC